MVIKAKAEITISRIVDIDHVTTYYLLQSSTVAAPAKPTTNPPGGKWQTTEPSYTAGSTNTLYFVDLTVLTNGSYSYSAVSKSSSYEAAKIAYNKAQNAQNTADSANDKVDNLEVGGRNLILNGRGNEKAGFFKNFSTITDDYGQISMKSKKTYVTITLTPGFAIATRDYIVGEKYIWSYDIMYTEWNFPTGTNIGELWMGQRYGSAPSGQTATGTWRRVTAHDLPEVGKNGCELNNWYHVEKVVTIPEKASDNVDASGAYILFYNPNADVEASFTARIKNVKLEKGNKATDWTPAPEDVDAQVAEAAKVASNYMKYDSTNGLVVGNVTAKTLGQNVQIGNSVVNIRNGSTILAQYGADTIYLGKNSKDSKIDLCNGSATIYSSVSDVGDIRTFNIKTGDNCDIHTETTVSNETANANVELRSLAYDGDKCASYHWGLTGSDPYGSSQISGEGGVIWAYARGGTGSAEMRINGQTSAIDLTGKTTINNSAGTSSTVINGGEISSASLTATGAVIAKTIKTSAGTSLDALATAAKYTYSVSGISITVWESPLMIRIKMSGTATAILATSNGYLSFGGIKATGMTPAIKKIWIQSNYEVSLRLNASKGKIELGYSVKNGTMVDIPSGIAINIDETFLLV